MKKVDWSNKKHLTNIVSQSFSYAEVLRGLNISCYGHNYKTLQYWLNVHNVSVGHFTSQHERLSKLNKDSTIPLDEILNGKYPTYSTFLLKKRILKEKILACICAECQLGSEWNNKPIRLQLDHINGDSTNHKLANLRILCPNCHSQTETFAGKNQKRAGTSKWKNKIGTRKQYAATKKQQYENEQQCYVKLVEQADIDFTKFGWVNQVAPIINQKPQKVNVWMKRIMPDFYENCYKRKSR